MDGNPTFEEVTTAQCPAPVPKRFYEKVVKVKADVVAIFIVSPARFPKSRLTIWTRPRWHHRGDAQGGMRKGGFQRSALKPPLRGEPRHRCVPAPLAGT